MGVAASVVDEIVEPDKCSHEYCEKWGPKHYHCCDCNSSIKDENHIAQEDSIIDSIVDNSVPEDAVYRGVTIQFLHDFATTNNCWNLTTRQVRRKFVMPVTRERRCRFVELPEMSNVVGRATTFVSHTWGAKFGDLVAALCDGGADRSRVVWVDIFAVRQWPSQKPDLDFSAVVRQCKSFLIVCSSLLSVTSLQHADMMSRNIAAILPEDRLQLAFLRVWCLVEVHAAILSGAVIILKAGTHDTFLENQMHFVSNISMPRNLVHFVDIRSAEATIPSDKQRILSDIESSGKGIESINDTIRAFLSGAVMAVKHSVMQCAACEDKLALERVLSDPTKYIVSIAACGYIELLRRVIDKGGDVLAVEDHRTPLSAAAEGGHVSCIELLLQHDTSEAMLASVNTAVYLAAKEGHTAVLKFLRKFGGSLSLVDREGTTLLMECAAGGHLECVKYLIANGCDVNQVDNTRTTALMKAAYGGHTKCVEELIRCGAVVGAVDDYGSTSLIHAVRVGSVDCMSLLVDGSNLERKDCYGKTALSYAMEGEGYTECVKLLVERGSSVDVQDHHGVTPLMMAVYGNDVTCVELLLRAGCDRTLKDENGKTALELAQTAAHDACIKVLQG